MRIKQTDIRELIVWALVALLLVFLISNKHSKTGTFNWTTPLWADQAGYYVYLPAYFVYDFDASKFPEKVDEKTGMGFSFDQPKNKVITRYTCGVALMQAPVFLVIHQIAGITGQSQDGFSGIYHKVPDWAALLYCLLGLFFLRKFLLFYFKNWVSWAVVAVVFFGTNVYYYAVDSTGMSHIYSFALVAIVLWLSKIIQEIGLKYRLLYVILWSLIIGLIVLIRPTNALIFPFLFFLDARSVADARDRIVRFFKSGDILVLAVSVVVVFLPQFLYWKYASGNYISDSYEGFGFTNWKSPKILELWFSPNNGLFLYNPLYLVAIIGLVLMIRDKLLNGWIILTTFLLASYIYASWFVFSFGCSFGSRNFVEYMPLFALPIGYIFSRKNKNVRQIAIVGIIALFTVANVQLVYSYNKCFDGGTWEFKKYREYWFHVWKFHQKLDMGNDANLTDKNEFSKTLYISAKKISKINYEKAIVKAKVSLTDLNSEAALVVSVMKNDSTYFWDGIRLKSQIADGKLNNFKTIEGTFKLPLALPENSTIAVYVWNKDKEKLQVKTIDFYLE
jgi:hypothetical protein